VVAKYAKFYIKDKLYTLILRLHQMVIKAGLRKINLSYSRISFVDISTKLNLPKNTDVEFIVAKGIRDGVLNAKIDHESQIVVIKE
jgi:26S proteasome regulatory subunit N3